MGRPFSYDEGSRVHMGTKFDKRILQLFDGVVKKYGYTRTQALEFLVIHAIVADQIPAKDQRINERLETMSAGESPKGVKKEMLRGPEESGSPVSGRRSKAVVNEKA